MVTSMAGISKVASESAQAKELHLLVAPNVASKHILGHMQRGFLVLEQLYNDELNSGI